MTSAVIRFALRRESSESWNDGGDSSRSGTLGKEIQPIHRTLPLNSASRLLFFELDANNAPGELGHTSHPARLLGPSACSVATGRLPRRGVNRVAWEDAHVVICSLTQTVRRPFL